MKITRGTSVESAFAKETADLKQCLAEVKEKREKAVKRGIINE